MTVHSNPEGQDVQGNEMLSVHGVSDDANAFGHPRMDGWGNTWHEVNQFGMEPLASAESSTGWIDPWSQ
jgi:hypothetical protein